MQAEEDWKGERFLHIERSPHGGGLYSVAKNSGYKPERTVKERGKKVAELAEKGMTAPDIARELGVDPSLVYRDARMLGITVQRVKPKAKE